MAKNATIISALSALDEAVARHYAPDTHCC
jgi:hypothetical protein